MFLKELSKMTIDTLYARLDQQRIARDVDEAIAECEARNVPANQRRYFSVLADEYGLVEAIVRQLRTAKSSEELTTNTEIAELFGAKHYSSVALYLQKRMNRKLYDLRVTLCLKEGGRRGGESCNASDFKHQLTPEEREWQKKKK